MAAGNWVYSGLKIDGAPIYLTLEPEVVETVKLVCEDEMKTLIAKNPSEARGIRKALKAAGLKFEFKTAGKRRKKARRNPAKKKSAKRRARRTRSKASSRRRR